MKSKLQKISIAAMCLMEAVFLSGCFLLPEEEEILAPPLKQPDKIIYDTYKVTRGTVENSITATGYIMPAKSENLQFKSLSGRISSMLFTDGDKVKKGDIMAEIDTYGVKNDIKRQEICVRMAEADMASAKRSGNNETIEKARLALELECFDLTLLKEKLAMSQLKAPFDGIITYCKRLSAGDSVDAYDIIYTVADPAKKIIKYTGDKAANFINGMQVRIRIDNADYKGFVASGPSDSPDKSLKDTAFIRCDSLPETAVIGKDVLISLVMEKRENVLFVPAELVKRYSGRTYVKVMKEGLIEERDVTVGLAASVNTEIISGLEENEEVVVW